MLVLENQSRTSKTNSLRTGRLFVQEKKDAQLGLCKHVANSSWNFVTEPNPLRNEGAASRIQLCIKG
jgi:hypothetical protein